MSSQNWGRSRRFAVIPAFLLGLLALYVQDSCSLPAEAQRGTTIKPSVICHQGITVDAVVVLPDGRESLVKLGTNFEIPCHLVGKIEAHIGDQPYETEGDGNSQSAEARAEEAVQVMVSQERGSFRPGRRSSVRLEIVTKAEHLHVPGVRSQDRENPLAAWVEEPPK